MRIKEVERKKRRKGRWMGHQRDYWIEGKANKND